MADTPLTNLHKELTTCFPDDLICIGAIMLGETDAHLAKLISVAIPTMVVAFGKKAGSTTNAAGILYLAELARKNPGFDQDNDFCNIQSSFARRYGSEIFAEVMGSNYKTTVQTLAAHSNTRTSSAKMVLEFLCGMSMFIIGRYVFDNSADADNLQQWLNAQQTEAARALQISFHGSPSVAHAAGTNGTFRHHTHTSLAHENEKGPAATRYKARQVFIICVVVLLVALSLFRLFA